MRILRVYRNIYNSVDIFKMCINLMEFKEFWDNLYLILFLTCFYKLRNLGHQLKNIVNFAIFTNKKPKKKGQTINLIFPK